MGETSQMTSGTLSVFAYLRFVDVERRHAVVGELPEEHRDRKASKTGGRSGRKAPWLEELHGRRQPDLVAKPLGSQLQRHEHVIRDVEGDLSHESLPEGLVELGLLAEMRVRGHKEPDPGRTAVATVVLSSGDPQAAADELRRRDPISSGAPERPHVLGTEPNPHRHHPGRHAAMIPRLANGLCRVLEMATGDISYDNGRGNR